MKTVRNYKGFIVTAPHGEGEGLFLLNVRQEGKLGYVKPDCPLAEEIQEDMRCHGNFLSVAYYISTEYMPLDDLKYCRLLHVLGAADVRYYHYYSDYTGYLYTREDIVVGGHDLLNELQGHTGKYVHLEIDFSKDPKDL